MQKGKEKTKNHHPEITTNNVSKNVPNTTHMRAHTSHNLGLDRDAMREATWVKVTSEAGRACNLALALTGSVMCMKCSLHTFPHLGN